MTSASSSLRFLVAAGLPVAALVLVGFPARDGTAIVHAVNTNPVLVTNSGAAQAVPVSYPTTPTVNVGSLPAVSVDNFPSTQTVAFASGAAIGINNAATNPVLVRDVDNAAHANVVQTGAGCEMVDSQASCHVALYHVADGFRLVVETITGEVSVPSGENVGSNILVDDNGSVHVLHELTATPQGTFFGSDLFTITHSVRMYFDSGQQLVAQAHRGPASGISSGHFYLTGYLVSCGSGIGCPMP